VGKRRAVISVYDKAGLVDFACGLAELGFEIVSTGGTARALREAGLAVRDVSEVTGFPELFGGRVKTLHPLIHGGILYRRGDGDHQRQAAEQKIEPVDLVVVNLYPFVATAGKPGVSAEELIENIDIGGPAMVRSAAKNFESVAVVTDPEDYARVLEELRGPGGLGLRTRLVLARKAFAATGQYDGEITTVLERLSTNDQEQVQMSKAQAFPSRLHLALERRRPMRYGENPHQAAALYAEAGKPPTGLAGAQQIQGKELSYNNLVDLDVAWNLVREFPRPAAAIIKHNNPCGVAEKDSQQEAYVKALACDPVSAFGGVLAFNRPLDAATAQAIAKLFVECLIAPGIEPAALETFKGKKNMRILLCAASEGSYPLELKRISGGILAQQADNIAEDVSEWKVETERRPESGELCALEFAWKVAKHVKSNAIVFAGEGETLGIGAGQMSRVDSVRIAVIKAASAGLPLAGSVVASDAYFPFPDGVEEAGKAGARAVVQPGGSVRDNEVIDAANRLGMAMVFTGIRHFRH
jgi:phosphoribosylaminoimidazolecarboxamide formyltransferase/IMP cyclohydrolase